MTGTYPTNFFTSTITKTTNGGEITTTTTPIAPILTDADEVFETLDVDNSGALSKEELIDALTVAAVSSPENGITISDIDQQWISDVAAELVELYDFDGNGVVDRDEYKSLVEDMAALQRQKNKGSKTLNNNDDDEGIGGFIGNAITSVKTGFSNLFADNEEERDDNDTIEISKTTSNVTTSNSSAVDTVNKTTVAKDKSFTKTTSTPEIPTTSTSKRLGTIELTGLRLDLRRLFFGAFPVVKHITPGGPLVLEPFTITVNGSFSRDDIMNSSLIDAGLRLLVGQVLRRRVRSIRDVLDGAMFFGRKWNLASEKAPQVQVPNITDISFDVQNRLIITGIARVQTAPGAPVIENTFKVKTKIGTRKEGRLIRLEEPELALVIECPKSFEQTIDTVCEKMELKPPPRPKPIYSFFPIYSPFKVDDDDGFDLGEDNCIKSIYIKDGALRFELSAVLRPGRFLGSHYLAFTLPIRTFIITLDRVKNGIRAARQAKRELKEKQLAAAEELKRDLLGSNTTTSTTPAKNTAGRLLSLTSGITPAQIKKSPAFMLNRLTNIFESRREHNFEEGLVKGKPAKSFFSRFVDGYLQADKEEEETNERLSIVIRDFFARQFTGDTNEQKKVYSYDDDVDDWQ